MSRWMGALKALQQKYEKQGKQAPHPWLPTEKWEIYIDGEKQTRLRLDRIKDKISPIIKEYWHQKNWLPAQADEYIDWDVLERAMNKAPQGL